MNYRKKPVEVEAHQLNEHTVNHLTSWVPNLVNAGYTNEDRVFLTIKEVKGYTTVNEGDWIVKDEEGKFSYYKPDVFKLNYEKVGKDA